MRKVSLLISGMHCASCAINVERVLLKIKGIHNVRISLLTGKVFFESDEELNVDEISKSISKLGYKLVEAKFD